METNTNEREQTLHSTKGYFFLGKMTLIQTFEQNINSQWMHPSECFSLEAEIIAASDQ
jgi:hypothetical protein